MTRLLASAALLAGIASAPAASAQVTSDPAEISNPTLDGTAAQFREDLTLVTHMIATAALVHDATGAFPTTAFGLLGSPGADRTGLRRAPLSSLDVSRDGDRLVLDYVPLPVSPYERQDDVVRLVVTQRADGTFAGDYEIRRREDPDRGGRMISYDNAGPYRVRRGYGTACVDPALLGRQLAAGTYTAEPGSLSATPLTVRVHPTDQAEPIFYQQIR